MTISEILQQAKALSSVERKELARLLMQNSDAGDAPVQRHLTELRGLGRDLWKGIDAQSYVNSLRDE